MEFNHATVLLHETIDTLDIRADAVYLDGTLGGGGHSSLILQKGGRVIGIDRDKEAISAATAQLEEYGDRFRAVWGNFADAAALIDTPIDGAILDLGVSSYQLDNVERGFSYKNDAPLDMRMNTEDEKTAFDVVNSYSVSELTRVLRDYGEEKFAFQIARLIEKRRSAAPIKTTYQLIDIIKTAIPAFARREGGHPAKRTFQAIRIEVNHELDTLKQAILSIFDILKAGGALAIITFHSLEDRIVKTTFAELVGGCSCPPDFPICVCGNSPKGELISSKPIYPSAEEIEQNKRSKSAKLRAIKKL